MKNSNLVNGKIPKGETCFISSECAHKKTACNGNGCPVADGKTHKVDFSCALARLAQMIGKRG